MKATPGPWKIDGTTVYALNLNGVNRFYAQISPGFADGKMTTKSELIANAALIAAAPDLLDVTKGFRQKLSTYVGIYSGDNELKRLLEDCDAAIRKAEGHDKEL